MTKKLSVLFIVFIVAFFSGCIGPGSTPQSSSGEQLSPQKITQAELAELIQEKGDMLLIDVRTEGEYNEGHLPGAIVIPYNEFDLRYSEILEYQDREVVLYCHTGGMGDYAGNVLIKNDFKNVKNLDGGIYGWINSGGKIA